MTEREREFFDILLIVPLEEELHEVARVFPHKENRSTDTGFRFTVDAGDPDLRVLLVQQEDMGRKFASRAVQDAAQEFDFGFIVCLGIAGSLTDDLRLCDVCYTGHVMDVYDNAKAEDVESGLDLSLSPSYYETLASVTAPLNFLRTFPELQELLQKWERACSACAEALLEGPVIERDGSERLIETPKSKNGLLACGVVTKSEKYNATVRKADRRVLAIETESGGVFEEGKRRGIPCLTIRGISDHADTNKNKLEKKSGAQVRKVAAHNAAQFLKVQLENPHFRRAIERRTEMAELPLGGNGGAISTSLTEVVRSIESCIDERLRELSPEFKLQAKGYQLPVPRIREIQYTTSLKHDFSNDPLEMREALNAENCILLSLVRSYPDYSLPWVIASNLLTAEVGGKQLLPVVISGDRLRPPRTGLDRASDYPVAVPEDVAGTTVVYILDEIPLTSPTRLRYLEEEIKKRPKAKFIAITRNETHLLAESEFASSVGGTFWHLVGVSFIEIAHFVQKNFEITPTESEVIALRLRDTFRHFDLSAHPTYFAGISKEVLTALLQANRRAELIQLAVDGFLTLVVAADKSAPVVLSRTTRTKFLRRVARIINIEKRAMRQEDIVFFAKEFADEFAFEIDPLHFVSSFVDSGILHFHDGNARFSLTFVESYMLALELVEDEADAISYFSLEHDDFDIGTFDIYAEMGAARTVVDHVIEGIDASIERFQLPGDEAHVLLGAAVRPYSMRNLGRLEALEKRLRETTDDVVKARGDVQRKQRMLDVADKVRETAAGQSGFGVSDGDEAPSEEARNVQNAINSWAVGTILLGAGAEDLKGDTKKTIAGKLVQLGAIIIHHWTSAHASVDFDAIKEQLTSEESIQDLLSVTEKSKDFGEAKKQVEGLVDIIEYSFVSEPLRRILGHLCESARQKVLASSVEAADLTGTFDQILRGIWLIDIDSERGKHILNETAKDIPSSPFLRVLLASHLLTRVYWSHWKKDDRLVLLDMADEIIKPVIRLKKGEMARSIEEDAKKRKRNPAPADKRAAP